MWFHVFMGGTKHVTMRIPDELVEAIDARAKRDQRSRSQVAVMILEAEFGGSDGVLGNREGSGTGSSADVGYGVSAPARGSLAVKTKRNHHADGVARVAACPECHALNGLHQRGCKAK